MAPDETTPHDPGRRRFFRRLGAEVAGSLGSVVAAVGVAGEESGEAARGLLGGAAGTGGSGAAVIDATDVGFRSPFRWNGDLLVLVDQRRLPSVIAEVEVRAAGDAVTAVRDGVVAGGPARAQVAAISLAIAATTTRAARPFARRAALRGLAGAFRSACPGSAAVGRALDRMLAAAEAAGPDAPGDAVAARLRAEAEAIVGEAQAAHGAIAGVLLAALPEPEAGPLRVLTAGSTGAMGGGQFGTALSGLVTAHHAGRALRVLVAEGRPALDGSRVAAWELRQAAVDHEVVTDAAAPGLVAAGLVDLVLVAPERVAANGDLVAPVGAYALALAARAAGVQFLACAPTSALDPACPSGADAPLDEGRASWVELPGGIPSAPAGTRMRNPLLEPVPAALVDGLVTEDGLLAAPWAASIAAAARPAARPPAVDPGDPGAAPGRSGRGTAAPARPATGTPGTRAAAPGGRR